MTDKEIAAFTWKYVDIDKDAVLEIQNIFLKNLPTNQLFFQPLDLNIKEFIGLSVTQSVLIQVDPNSRDPLVHTDHRIDNTVLALNIPLINCHQSITELWKSSSAPEIKKTANGQPYKIFDITKCEKLTEFILDKPVLFRTDIPHRVINRSELPRKAISIRFKTDPWYLINRSIENLEDCPIF
jgi:hypothetical protein